MIQNLRQNEKKSKVKLKHKKDVDEVLGRELCICEWICDLSVVVGFVLFHSCSFLLFCCFFCSSIEYNTAYCKIIAYELLPTKFHKSTFSCC